jgi:hypothetical protein
VSREGATEKIHPQTHGDQNVWAIKIKAGTQHLGAIQRNEADRASAPGGDGEEPGKRISL